MKITSLLIMVGTLSFASFAIANQDVSSVSFTVKASDFTPTTGPKNPNIIYKTRVMAPVGMSFYKCSYDSSRWTKPGQGLVVDFNNGKGDGDEEVLRTVDRNMPAVTSVFIGTNNHTTKPQETKVGFFYASYDPSIGQPQDVTINCNLSAPPIK